MSKLDKSEIQKIVRAIEFLNSHGYVVKEGRSTSPQLKKNKVKQ